MKYVFFFILLMPAVTNIQAQTYFKGRQVVAYSDPARANRQVNTELFYPANTAGNNVPIASGSEKFPVVVFGHGFVIPVSAYAWLADSLVKYGYIVAMPTTESGLAPSHDNFGKDISFLCTAIISAGNSPGSFLYQRVKNKTAVAGHSMGGGASFLAASGNSPATVLFNFAAAETNPSAINAASLTNKPALIFSGSNDCIVAPSVQQSMYTNVNNTCKTYININGALHCQFANNNGTCAFGQITSGCNSSPITASAVYNKISVMLLPFLDYYLKDQCLRGIDFLNAYANITGVTKLSNCTSFPACGPLPVNLMGFYGKVSGKTAHIFWNVSTESNLLHYTIERSFDGSIFKPLLQEWPKGNNAEYKVNDLYPYPGASYYRLKITDRDGSISYSNIIMLRTKDYQIAITGFYPNPVKNILHVEIFSNNLMGISTNTNMGATYKILSVQGQSLAGGKIKLQPSASVYTFPVGTLAAGVYLFHISAETGKLTNTLKFIKE